MSHGFSRFFQCFFLCSHVMCFSYVFLGMLPKYTVKPGLFATTCPEALMCLEKTFTSITVKCGIKMTALLSSPEIEGASILNALRMLLACKGLFEYFFGMCVCVCACLSLFVFHHWFNRAMFGSCNAKDIEQQLDDNGNTRNN